MLNIFSENKTFIISILLTVLSGLSIRIVLAIAKQKWVSTYHHTMSYALLPLITLVITKVISGNIALSLGMIGALSIVRFRNPVKNPFELVLFFALITIGISMAVDIKYGLFLACGINIIILISYLYELLGIKLGFQTYSLSFDEGYALNVLEIESSSKIEYLENSIYLIEYVNDKTTSTNLYRLASRNKENLNRIRLDLENNSNILRLEQRF